jgi:AcrR family transcriptional regulator
MARPSKELAADTQDRLLEGAEGLFALNGLKATRLEDVAKFAGISRPSLLYHFSSKDLLYESVVTRIFDALAMSLGGAMAGQGDFDEQLLNVVRSFSEFLANRPNAAAILLREVISPEGPGRRRLVELGGPMIDQIEIWVSASGRIRPEVSVRSLLMHIVSDTLLRNGTGELKTLFWKSPEEPASWSLVKAMLIPKDS